MNPNTNKDNPEQSNLFKLLMFRYFPYWPLFAALIILGFVGAWGYMRYSTPMYESSATILLKDEKKGADDSRFMESFNIYTSKKIVENEIEVIHSRTLMAEVVNELALYAPVSEEGRIHSNSAYLSSPVIVEVKNPKKLVEQKKVYFSFNSIEKKVKIDDNLYPLDQWVMSPYGILKFSDNPYKAKPVKKKLFFSLVDPKQVTYTLRENLAVSPTNKLSTVVKLKYKDEVPQRAENILNALVESYNRAAINDKNTLATNTLAFVEDRIKLVEHELDSIEKRIQQLKSQKGIVDLSEQGRLFLQNVGDNDRKVADVNMQLAVLDQVEKYVISKDSRGGIVPSTLGLNDAVLSKLLDKLYDGEAQYERLKKTTGENNPVLASVANEIERIRPGILESIRNQRASLQASRGNINATNGTYTSQLQAIPQKERELLEINRQQAIKSNVYTFLLQKREETALSYSSTVPDSRVVDTAESSIQPVSPKKLIVLAAAIVIALVIGISIVNGKELLSGKILFRSDIEKFTRVAIAGEIANAGKAKVLVVGDPKWKFVSEQFRHLRAALGYYGRKHSNKKLLITSSVPGEGKSFIAANLAISTSLAGKKVVLIDADLRNQKTTEVFNVSTEKGLVDLLQGEVEPYEIIKSTSFNNLFVIGAGAFNSNPTELLLNGKLNALFLYLEETFDQIIVDTSPVDPLTDAYVLSEYCDTTLYVIRHAYTPKTFVEMIDESNAVKALKNMTIVFNGVRSRGFVKGKFGFGYGYGYEYVYKERISSHKKVGVAQL